MIAKTCDLQNLLRAEKPEIIQLLQALIVHMLATGLSSVSGSFRRLFSHGERKKARYGLVSFPKNETKPYLKLRRS